MKKYLLFLATGLLFIIPAKDFAQKGFFKFFLHFETGKTHLDHSEKKSLDKIIDTLRKNAVIKIVYVKGYTDDVGDEELNQKLSQARSLAVKSHLVKKKVATKLIVVKSYGEEMPVADNETEDGKQKNRRVEVVVSYQRNEAKIPSKQKADDENSNPCARDTVIILARGTQISMNICEWRKEKDFIRIEEFTDFQSLLGSDMNTMTASGQPMISGGMFRLRLRNDSCLRKPITIRKPVEDSCLGDARLSLWNMTIGNRWGEDKTNRGLRIVRIEGKKYYEFDIFCPGGKNLDVKIENYIDDSKRFRFTINKKKCKLLDVRITYQCPDAVLTSNNKHPRKSLFVKGFCPQNEPFVTATAINRKGDTLDMKYRLISTLAHSKEPCDCENSMLQLKKETTKNSKEKNKVGKNTARDEGSKPKKRSKEKATGKKQEGFEMYKNYKLNIRDFEPRRKTGDLVLKSQEPWSGGRRRIVQRVRLFC